MTKKEIERENLVNTIMLAGDLAYIPNGDMVNEDNLRSLKTSQLKSIIENINNKIDNEIERVYIENDFGFVVTTGAGTFKYKYVMNEDDKKDPQYFKDCVKEAYKDSYNRDSQFIQLEVA